MKDTIAKFFVWIFISLIVLTAIYCFLKGKWINGVICLILAFIYSPSILDKIAKKLELKIDYFYIFRFILSILAVFLILFTLLILEYIMTNHGVSNQVILSRMIAICKSLVYVIYLAIIFLYNDTNKKRKLNILVR